MLTNQLLDTIHILLPHSTALPSGSQKPIIRHFPITLWGKSCQKGLR